MSRVDYECASSKFILDKNTGKLYWKESGLLADCVNDRGYFTVFLNGISVKSHRVVWLLTYGKWPDNVIDHIDGNTKNNTPNNLRDVSRSHNGRNRKISNNNSSGYTGVTLHKKSNRWQAQMVLNGHRLHLGMFVRIEDAIEARKAAEIKYGFIDRRTTC